MNELSEREALALAREYLSQTLSQEDAVRIVAILTKCDIAGMIKFAYAQGLKETTDIDNVDLIRDAFNRGYEKGYKKGKDDEILAVRQAQADRDFYDWRREIKKEGKS